MNVVEREAARATVTAVEQPDQADAPASVQLDRRARLRPLLSLLPYIARYRLMAGAALVALVVAAITTLVVPLAVRRMIDFGFSRDSAHLIDSYFTVLIGVVAVLALSSAARFYLVTTPAQRIVPPLRHAALRHL